MELSPDGRRVAMMALGKLWAVSVDGAARVVTAIDGFGRSLTWSPDGTSVVWSGGREGTDGLPWPTPVLDLVDEPPSYLVEGQLIKGSPRRLREVN